MPCPLDRRGRGVWNTNDPGVFVCFLICAFLNCPALQEGTYVILATRKHFPEEKHSQQKGSWGLTPGSRPVRQLEAQAKPQPPLLSAPVPVSLRCTAPEGTGGETGKRPLSPSPAQISPHGLGLGVGVKRGIWSGGWSLVNSRDSPSRFQGSEKTRWVLCGLCRLNREFLA